MKIISPAMLCAALLAVGATSALAAGDVTVSDGWVRASVAGQQATGAFMHIESKAGGKLVAVQSPAAGRAEVHEMKRDGDVMRMRPLTSLNLPAGRPVDLTPGGYHVMLMQLKQPLKAGDTVPLTLTVEGAGGQREEVSVQLPVKPLGATAAAKGGHDMQHMQGHMHMDMGGK
jgi:copper(I)-binding protein